jgi:hypothetical protein
MHQLQELIMGSDNLYLAVLDVLFKLKHDSRILLVEHPSHDHHNFVLCAALPPTPTHRMSMEVPHLQLHLALEVPVGKQ